MTDIRVKFDNKAEEIEAWMNVNPDYSTEYPKLAVLSQLLTIGRTSDESAQSMYDAIRACFAGIEGAPFRKGKTSSLPAQVVANADSKSQSIDALYTALMAEHEDVALLMTRHGRSGGGLYDEPSEYGEAVAKPVNARLKKAYTSMVANDTEAEYWWDGELPVNLIQPSADSEDSE
jgi:hypothetical protein